MQKAAIYVPKKSQLERAKQFPGSLKGTFRTI